MGSLTIYLSFTCALFWVAWLIVFAFLDWLATVINSTFVIVGAVLFIVVVCSVVEAQQREWEKRVEEKRLEKITQEYLKKMAQDKG